MAKIESKKVIVNSDIQSLHKFLCDLNNIEQLLPKDKISNWESSKEYCSFKVQSAATIDLQLKDDTNPEVILLTSGEKSPFPFTLHLHLKQTDSKTEGFLLFEASLNPFLKMMVEKPLGNLFNYMADQLVAINE